MTEEELFSLPPSVVLKLLVQSLGPNERTRLLAGDKPKMPLPPKYDLAIYRSGGVQFASETDLAGLRYWHKRATESAASGSQYAEKDKKKAANLERWIAWRECFPDTVWSGERNDAAVTAKPPNGKPTVYESQRGGGAAPRPAPAPAADEGIDPDEDIPF